MMDTELEERPATALTVQQRAVLALGSDKARTELQALAAESVSITEVKNPAGRDQAHSAGMKLVRARTDIEKRGKAARDDATKFSKAVIAEEKALIAIIEPEEQRVLALRDAWDQARAAERAEAERKERARIDSIRLRIADIRECAVLASQCRTSTAMRDLLQKLVADPLEGFAEFQDEAIAVRDAALERIRGLIVSREADEAQAERDRQEREAERQRLEAERAELERQRQEQAERDRIAAQERAAADAAAKAAREAEEARLRAEREAQEAELRRQREEVEAQQRAVREQQEALQRQQVEAARAAAQQAFIETSEREAVDPAPIAVEVAEEPSDEIVIDAAIRGVMALNMTWGQALRRIEAIADWRVNDVPY